MDHSPAFTRGFIKAAESSFLGRYIAATSVDDAIAANKVRILEQIDPAHKLDTDLFLTSDMFKKQRQLGYDYVPETLRRRDQGTPLKNALLHGVLGAGVGGMASAVRGGISVANHPEYKEYYPWLVGGGAALGGLVGGASGALSKLLDRYKHQKVTPEDLARMKEKQKDRSIKHEFMPFGKMWDAAHA